MMILHVIYVIEECIKSRNPPPSVCQHGYGTSLVNKMFGGHDSVCNNNIEPVNIILNFVEYYNLPVIYSWFEGLKLTVPIVTFTSFRAIPNPFFAPDSGGGRPHSDTHRLQYSLAGDPSRYASTMDGHRSIATCNTHMSITLIFTI